MQPTSPPAPDHTTRPARIGLLDLARGLAILAVIGYHLVWDLGDLGFIAGRPAQSRAGENIATGIAGTFLFLVGVSLVLAHGNGFRARSFVRRQLELLGYAALISVVTYVAMPSLWVSFGILHCIAVVSVLALPFVRAPMVFALAAAVLALRLPRLIEIPGDSRWWSWTGLTQAQPATIDSAPVLPMFALTLLGLALMRTLRQSGVDQRLARISTDRGPLHWLSVLGRHTLVIYVVHQPVLLGVLHAVRWIQT